MDFSVPLPSSMVNQRMHFSDLPGIAFDFDDDYEEAEGEEKGPFLLFAPSATSSFGTRLRSKNSAVIQPRPQRPFQQQQKVYPEEEQLSEPSAYLINNDGVDRFSVASPRKESAFQKKEGQSFGESMQVPRLRMKQVDRRMNILDHDQTLSPTSIMDDEHDFFMGTTNRMGKSFRDFDASIDEGGAESPCDFMLAFPSVNPSTPEHEKEKVSFGITDLEVLRKPEVEYYDSCSAPRLCFPSLVGGTC